MDDVARHPLSFQIVEADCVRAAIAAAVLGDPSLNAPSPGHIATELGTIDLHPHQIEAVDRLRAAMAEFGGALLADPVGRGKTFIALALVQAESTAIVVAPSVLRSMWLQAAAAATRNIEFVSFETLSRRAVNPENGDLLIVDEAHHARNPATKRFASLSRLAYRRDVLLLSATPIHNRRRDLCAVLSLFLGRRAGRLTNAELGRCVVRRDGYGRALPSMPGVEPLQWLTVEGHDDTVPEMILSLPPPLPPAEGGDGGVLIAHSLIRPWASSDAALRGALMRRLQRSTALISALEDGTYPSRQELAAWIGDGDSVQLVFSALVAGPAGNTADLLAVVRLHRGALRELLAIVNRDQTRDAERASIVRRIRDKYPGEKVVAFTQFGDTVDCLFSQLAADGRVAALTGSGARVAGGKLTRADAIGRFAPLASNRTPPGEAEQITLLITTDLLSEGVNLQDASVVIHLDLPWTPARMEQRLGRVARLGSLHDKVSAYAMRPPARAESMIRIEQILREKTRAAGIIVPSSRWIPGGLVATAKPETATPEAATPIIVESIRQIVTHWKPESATPHCTLVGAVKSSASGFLAVCSMGERVRSIASIDEGMSDDPAIVLECVRCAGGVDAPITPEAGTAFLTRLDAWLEASRSLENSGASERSALHPARAAMNRIALILSRARPHQRSALASLCDRARIAVERARGAEEEQRLADLTASVANDTAWLEDVIASGAFTRLEDHRPAVSRSNGIVAMLILRNDP